MPVSIQPFVWKAAPTLARAASGHPWNSLTHCQGSWMSACSCQVQWLYLLSSLDPSLKHRREGRENCLPGSFLNSPPVLDWKPRPRSRRLKLLTFRCSHKNVLKHIGNIQIIHKHQAFQNTASWNVYWILLAEMGQCRTSWGRKIK